MRFWAFFRMQDITGPVSRFLGSGPFPQRGLPEGGRRFRTAAAVLIFLAIFTRDGAFRQEMSVKPYQIRCEGRFPHLTSFGEAVILFPSSKMR